MENILFTLKVISASIQLSFGVALLSGCKFTQSLYHYVDMHLFSVLKTVAFYAHDILFTVTAFTSQQQSSKLMNYKDELAKFFSDLLVNYNFILTHYAYLVYGVVGLLWAYRALTILSTLFTKQVQNIVYASSQSEKSPRVHVEPIVSNYNLRSRHC